MRIRRHARCALLLLCYLLAIGSGQAAAEQLERFGDLEVHYIVFNTTTLLPEIAERYGVPRAENQGLVNISGRRVQDDGTTLAVPLTIEGTVANLVGQMRSLSFDEITEPGAIYYLETVTFTDRETLRFDLTVTDLETGRRHRLRFQKELWRQ